MEFLQRLVSALNQFTDILCQASAYPTCMQAPSDQRTQEVCSSDTLTVHAKHHAQEPSHSALKCISGCDWQSAYKMQSLAAGKWPVAQCNAVQCGCSRYCIGRMQVWWLSQFTAAAAAATAAAAAANFRAAVRCALTWQ